MISSRNVWRRAQKLIWWLNINNWKVSKFIEAIFKGTARIQVTEYISKPGIQKDILLKYCYFKRDENKWNYLWPALRKYLERTLWISRKQKAFQPGQINYNGYRK